MTLDEWSREGVIAAGAVTYPVVWIGAGIVGYVAGALSGVESGTRGLGYFLAGFALGVVVLSVLWAAFVFLATARFGRRGRAAVAATATPIFVVACAFESFTLAGTFGLVLPVVACWWATEPL